ncbi:carbohydrate-binding protein [Kribbella sp. NBC_00709]|uniref:carbohydrate-binding protein n=1 Tax=Kribbella sp. NBC_00709 TaxID=2975972 RepID=UPI002E2A573E|nr:carbohydrate-binding protein [Kribbella sp. NBC_00709]
MRSFRRLAAVACASVLTAVPVATVFVVPAAADTAAVTAAGATVPFTSYEAEVGSLGGGATSVSLTAAPTTQYSSASLEASGHAYAHLAATGQSVQWTNNTGHPISAITVRLSIPDSASGGGQTSTLNLYVDGGLRQTLNVNSKQTWLYEGNNYNGNSQSPSDGDPRVFFDETRTFVTGTPIAAGGTFMLRKDSGNSAAFYDIDVVDVENPPAPIAQPANSISITDCGAVADNTPTNGAADPASVDSRAAIQNCINQAQSQGKTVWIPAGTFYVKGTQGLQAQGITIAGAGAWYSTIYRDVPLPNSTPLPALWGLTSTTIQNLHVDSNATSRATVDGAGGSMDVTGTNWVADGIWTQHTLSGFWASGTGGTIRNNRLTTIWADGANVNNVSMGNSVGNNLTITNNFVRGTGDDALAINSVNYNDIDGTRVYYTPMANAVVTNNTSIAPWGGKGVGVYGGSGHRIENNYVSDTARYIGLGAGRFGVNGNDLLSASVTGNLVVRSGGNAYSQGQPAFHIGNGGDGQNVGVVDRVTASNNTIVDSLYDGIGFSTSTNTVLQNNTVTSPWRNGIVIAPPFYPAPSGSATITGNTVAGGGTPYLNSSGGFSATLSGNSWQGGTTEGPYGGTPAAIPGAVQAENYNTGGQGVAYNVGSINGTGNSYRTDGVDLESTADTGGGYNLGWTSTGQWFHYTVNVATAGTYSVAMRVATPAAVTNALHVASASGTNLSGNVSLPSTGGWQNWSTVTTQVNLPAGLQTLTVYQDNGGWNLNSLQFASGSTATANLAAGKPTSECSRSGRRSIWAPPSPRAGERPSPRTLAGRPHNSPNSRSGPDHRPSIAVTGPGTVSPRMAPRYRPASRTPGLSCAGTTYR